MSEEGLQLVGLLSVFQPNRNIAGLYPAVSRTPVSSPEPAIAEVWQGDDQPRERLVSAKYRKRE